MKVVPALVIAIAFHAASAFAQSITITGSVSDSAGGTSNYSVTVSQSSVSGRVFYISINGADTNDGLSKVSPWRHAPGMIGCVSNCSTAVPKSGDRYVFRGGESWHSTVPLWTWTWSGAAGNPIYIGVDNTWFVGSSWSRPIVDMDNPLSTSQPTSCPHDETSVTAIKLNGSYLQFDNFEFRGKCWGGDPHAAYLSFSGANNTISNSYFHGWTMATTASDDTHYMILGTPASNWVTNNVIAGNTFDGSDSTFGTTPGKATGFSIYQECYEVRNNVFRHVSNGAVCSNITTVHDNLFEYMYEPNHPQVSIHGNVVETLGGIAGAEAYYYNNVVRHTNEGVTIWMQAATFYNFNNVFFDIANPTNCLMQNPPGFSSGSGSAVSYIYNNTFVTPCNVRFSAANSTTPSWSGPAYFENNHFIGWTNLNSTTDCDTTVNCSIHDNGAEVYQSVADAAAQGYTEANNFAPGPGDITINAGMNLTSMCSTIPALCKTSTLMQRPATGSWNAGAY